MQSLSVFLNLVLLLVVPFDETKKDSAPGDNSVANEALRQELLTMFKVDQELRNKLIAWMQKTGQTNVKKLAKDVPPEVKQLQELDKRNTERLKKIIDQHGWPGVKLVGVDGANAAWLLVQHADQDRPFQKKCLALMEEAAKKGDASKSDLAYLIDRVLVAEGKKQRYGTQFTQKGNDWAPQPIEDEAKVDERRAEMGLPSMAEYTKMIKAAYQSKDEKNKGEKK